MAVIDYEFLPGEIKFVGIKVTSQDAFTVGSQTVEISKCPENTVEVATTAAELVDVSGTEKDIKYNVDSSVLSGPSVFAAEFTFIRDGLETRKRKVHFKLLENKC